MLEQIDHIGIAVKDLKRAVETYTILFGRKPEPVEEIASEKVRVGCYWVRNMRVELLEPTSPESPIATFIAKRGEGLHHIAFKVDDMERALAEYKSQGFQLVNETPFTAAGCCQVAFIHPKSTNGVLLELVGR